MIKILSCIATYCRAILSYAVHSLSYFIPKDEKIWIFIGWRRSREREIFAENTKYFFLYAHHHLKGVRPIWIGMDNKICKILQNKGYEAYPVHSLKGMCFALRASHTFISGLLQLKNWKFTGNTKVVQLWHGKSLKKTGYNSPYSFQRYQKFLNPNLFAPLYKFVAISEYLSDFIISDFHIPKKDILITGIPKYDALLDNKITGAQIDLDTELDTQIEIIKAKNPNRLFFYGPTFRPDGSNPLLQINLYSLNEVLQKSDDYVIISLHPKFSTKDWMPIEGELSNIYFSQGDMDKYPIMHKFDALITDYSSLAIDFLFMNKPVILFAYDLDTFTKEMGVYDELWSLMPGPKVSSFDELLEVIATDLQQFIPFIEVARNKIFAQIDTNASHRIAEEIQKLMSAKDNTTNCNNL